MDEVRKFNFDKLEKELQDVVSQEKQYWLENDAKIRAVKQGVPSYDHFRLVVLLRDDPEIQFIDYRIYYSFRY